MRGRLREATRDKQVTTQRLHTLIDQGSKLTKVLKVVAKQYYGHANEKLLEFGIEQFHSRATPPSSE